jgi:hypothetical protein
MGIRNGGIRNESMKKLGTPIGAGPGSESEKVGLVAAGTPLPVGRSFAGELGFAFLPCFFLGWWAFCVAPVDDGASPWLAPVGIGVVLDELVVVLDDDDPDLDP